MKTNITIDNYEAYLLDYLEGNLSPDEAEQLKAFVAAQGLDWAELTEELPHLEAPQIEFEGKERLKQRSLSLRSLRPLEGSKGRPAWIASFLAMTQSDNKKNTVPLYVKIASVAAAAGLLLTVGFWPEKSLPKVNPVVQLKPILPGRLITADEVTPVLPSKTMTFTPAQSVAKEQPTVFKKKDMPLLAELEPMKPLTIPSSQYDEDPNLELLACRLSANLAFLQHAESDLENYWEHEEDYERQSLLGRGILWLTKGRHDSFASMFGAGMRKAKQGIKDAATDMALTAYQRSEEQFEDTRGRWEQKKNE